MSSTPEFAKVVEGHFNKQKKSVKDYLYDSVTDKLTFTGRVVVTAAIGTAAGAAWWGIKTFVLGVPSGS